MAHILWRVASIAMMLAASKGSTISVSAEGQDADAAIAARGGALLRRAAAPGHLRDAHDPRRPATRAAAGRTAARAVRREQHDHLELTARARNVQRAVAQRAGVADSWLTDVDDPAAADAMKYLGNCASALRRVGVA